MNSTEYASEVARYDPTPIRALTADEAGRLLRAAMECAPDLLPAFALGLFAGLRPHEIARLDAGAIGAKVIRVGAGVAKKRRLRLVDVAPALRAWLDAVPPISGRIPTSRARWRVVVSKSGVAWSPDVLRHTFATMHHAAHEDAQRTALQLGHLGTAVLFDHYRALATREEAAAFWALRP